MTRVSHIIVSADVEIVGGELCVPLLLRRDEPRAECDTYETIPIPINAVGAERISDLMRGLGESSLSCCERRKATVVYRDSVPVALVTVDHDGNDTAEIPLTDMVWRVSLFTRCVSAGLAGAIALVSDHTPTRILAVAIVAVSIFSPQVRP